MRREGRASEAAYARLIDSTKCHDQLAVIVYVKKREDLTKHLNMVSLPSPCGKKFDQVFTGWTAPVDGDDAGIVDKMEMGESTPERIAEFCTKAHEMASVTIERFEEEQLVTFVILALI